MRVLVVEDDTAVRDGLLDALDAEGHEAVGVVNGEAALARLDGGYVPDVIVLDLMMPVMSGPELRARLKRHPDYAQIPVVVLSAVSQQTLAQARGEAALRKPFDLDELLELLERVVRERREAAP